VGVNGLQSCCKISYNGGSNPHKMQVGARSYVWVCGNSGTIRYMNHGVARPISQCRAGDDLGKKGHGMITFNCPQCGLELKVKVEHAGQWGNCRHCGTKLRVPMAKPSDSAPAAASSPAAASEFESVEGFDDIAAGIAGQYEPVEEVEEAEEVAGAKPRAKKAAAQKSGIKPIYLVVPLLLLLAAGSYIVFLTPPADEPIPEQHRLPQQDLDTAMRYLTDRNLFPNVEWVDSRPDDRIVVIGWRKVQNIPGGEVPPKRVVNNAATIASDSLRGEATVYLVDTALVNQTWRPGQPGVLDSARAVDGMVQ